MTGDAHSFDHGSRSQMGRSSVPSGRRAVGLSAQLQQSAKLWAVGCCRFFRPLLAAGIRWHPLGSAGIRWDLGAEMDGRHPILEGYNGYKWTMDNGCIYIYKDIIGWTGVLHFWTTPSNMCSGIHLHMVKHWGGASFFIKPSSASSGGFPALGTFAKRTMLVTSSSPPLDQSTAVAHWSLWLWHLLLWVFWCTHKTGCGVLLDLKTPLKTQLYYGVLIWVQCHGIAFTTWPRVDECRVQCQPLPAIIHSPVIKQWRTWSIYIHL